MKFISHFLQLRKYITCRVQENVPWPGTWFGFTFSVDESHACWLGLESSEKMQPQKKTHTINMKKERQRETQRIFVIPI